MPAKIIRTVSQTPELTALIDAKVDTGLYGSASEVVCAALRLMEEQDRREERITQAPERRSDAR